VSFVIVDSFIHSFFRKNLNSTGRGREQIHDPLIARRISTCSDKKLEHQQKLVRSPNLTAKTLVEETTLLIH
jgi:hypothetical protein